MPILITGGNNPQDQEKKVVEEKDYSEPKHTEDVKRREPDMQTSMAAPIAVPTIVDQTVPVVVFVGPPASGKSMILVRLAKYLRWQGYTVEADETFLNTAEYKEACEEFNEKLDTNIALDGSVKFLLVTVSKGGRVVAKLLEAPGEDFYTTATEKKEKNKRIEPYLSTIMTSPNPKSYVVLLDLDSEISFRRDEHHRNAYSNRFLNFFYPNIDSRRDRVILLYNKIDKTPYGNINGCVDPTGAKTDAKMYYRQLFATMRVRSFGGFVTSDNFVLKTFCTGMFSWVTDDKGKDIQTYNAASDVYPQELWKEITRRW